MTTILPALNDLDRVLTSVTRLTAGISEDQWTWDTPCSEWNVHGLLNHLHIGNLSFAAQLRGEPAPRGGVDHLGSDPHDAFLAGATDLLKSFALPGVLDMTFESPMGPAPGNVLLRLRVGETFVHGWDLARATNQPPDLPADLAQTLLDSFQKRLAAMPSRGPFGPAQPAADDAPPMDQLVALLGRRP
jgi:uncharacterized protein (TIGR03086 family)